MGISNSKYDKRDIDAKKRADWAEGRDELAIYHEIAKVSSHLAVFNALGLFRKDGRQSTALEGFEE